MDVPPGESGESGEPTPDRASLVAPRVRWHHPVGQSPAPVVVGDRVVSVGRELACLSADDGRVLWRLADSGSWWLGPPAVDGDRLYVTHATGGVACFALADGRTVWQRPNADVLATGQPCAVVRSGAGATVLVGTKSGVRALSADDGEELWSTDLGGPVELRPASDGERVLAGTRGGTFAALALADGQVLWKRAGGAQYGWTDPVVAGGVCYVGDRGLGGSTRKEYGGKLTSEVEGSRGGALNAFDVETGELLWGRIFNATGLSDPFVTSTDVWCGFGTVVAPFARADGSVREDRLVRTGRNPFGSPRVLGDQLIFGNLDGHLYVHDAESLELLWTFSPAAEGDRQVGGWTAAHGRLYVATTLGLFALEDPPDARPVAAGTSILPEPGGEPAAAPAEVPVVAAPRFENAHELAQAWADRIAPRDDDGEIQEERVDPVDRAAALGEIEVALQRDDVARRHAALLAIARVREVGLEHLRWLVEPLARDGDPSLRVAALYALWAVGPDPDGTRADDLALVHAAWDAVDAESRMRLPHLLSMFGEGVIAGRSEELVLSLLDEPGASFRSWINGLWGARVTDRIAARLVELATDPRYEAYAYDAFYYALSTLQGKQPDVIAVLLDALASPDHEWVWRSAWGLSFGIPDELQPGVADAVVARWPGLGEHARREVAIVVQRFGTADQVAALGIDELLR